LITIHPPFFKPSLHRSNTFTKSSEQQTEYENILLPKKIKGQLMLFVIWHDFEGDLEIIARVSF